MPALPPIVPSLPHAGHSQPARGDELRRVASAELLGGGREVLTEHGDQTYRLCLTASNKVILVK